MEALADVVRAGKALYIGVSEWTADQIRDAHGLARELKIPFVSNQPQYNMLWRVIEAEVIPTSQELGIGQVVWSPIAQGVLTGKYLPGQQPPSDSRAAHEEAGASMRDRLKDDMLDTRAGAPTDRRRGWVCRWRSSRSPGCSPTQPSRSAIIGASRPEQVSENVKASGQKLDADVLARIDDVLGPDIVRDPSLTQTPGSRG